MLKIRLQEVITNSSEADAYILFRTIEDWCLDNIPRTHWTFDHSMHMSVCGVDVPGGIIFWYNPDAIAFKLKFQHRTL